MRVGGPKVTRAQLEHLLQASEQANVTICVIPFVADGFAGAGFPLQYVGGVVPRLDTAQFDTTHGAEFIDAPAQLNRYRARLERVEGAALPPEASLDFIRRIAQQL